MEFRIGADPELFLCNAQGKLISSIGLIGGTKDEPKPISPVGHAIQEDNVSVEFNIPPSDSRREFVEHIDFVLSHLRGRAAELNLQFAVGVAAASFDPDQLMTPEALVFGCEPDFNAWTGRVNPRPFCEDATLRSCGGHVHVQIPDGLNREEVVKAMDVFLGVPSVELDKDTKRRQLYGKYGAYRPKSYGAEYRTLSNFWIWEKQLTEWVYDQTQRALEFVANGKWVLKKHERLIKNAINNGDLDSVRYIKEIYGV